MRALLLLLFIHSSVFLYSQNDQALTEPRERININREWKVKLGDHPGAEATSYDDKAWSNINLPHNFSIPYFRSPHWYTGYGWYRKYFNVPAQWKSKRVFVEFEGVFRVAQIYVNGHLVGIHKGGYTGFSLDITDWLRIGENVLAVRLNNDWSPRLAPRNGDYNFTGGIYRNVYLVITNQVHVTWYGTFVTTPTLSRKSGIVNIKTEIRNDGNKTGYYTLTTDIVNPSGKIVTAVSSNVVIPGDSTVEFDQTTTSIKAPKLWSPQHPFMYKAVSVILDKEDTIDRYVTPFGFRWIKWTADKGFFLNGKHYYFKGADVHQDHAGWASAITDAGILRDVRMIKDCGMDFIRGSHYAHSPSFSDDCDTLGILLWEENDFWGSGGTQQETGNWYDGAGAYPMNAQDQPYFEESVKNDLRDMIRIHRNHPSIIVWSMCNEPFFTDASTMPRVRQFLKALVQLSHKLDPTRPAAIGGCQRGNIDKIGDVAGYNGDGARLFINPGIPNVVTEYGSTIAKRPGQYAPGWGDLQQKKFAWRSGQALWCGFDYGTRAGDFGMMGMIDYFRLPKDMWYWYRNQYKHIPPPPPAIKGIPAKLKLMADKTTISNTNGTDDVQLIVSVLDKDGRQLSNSPDVTLQIVSGPGEFPTGNSITFRHNSDIDIRDGKAAIEFRSYHGGKTVIRAMSHGLQSDSIVIETKGHPIYIEGATQKTVYPPYVCYTLKKESADNDQRVDIAFQKPTVASSEIPGKLANQANDKDTTTMWQSDGNAPVKWWQVDLENLYTISEIKLMLPLGESDRCTIEVSKDSQHWTTIATQNVIKSTSIYCADSKVVVRFLRIIFTDSINKPVAIKEVMVYGNPIN